MKKLSPFDKFLFVVNIVLASILLVSYLSYYLSPNFIPIISVLSLFVPALIILNALFAFFWIVRLKKVFLLSFIVLLIGYQYISVLYKFKEKKILLTDDIKIMSYNVRLFNLYKWINEENVDQKIAEFIKSKDPDIICFQEYHTSHKIKFNYPYKYIVTSENRNSFGQAIYSKFKIIDQGSIHFSKSSNNAIFVDVLRGSDTLRIYNTHLESLKINPEKEEISQENSEKLKIRLENAFKIQANQVSLILHHQNRINHKAVICGDFNNTAFSWVYKQLKNDKKDAFEEAGKNFGSTYVFKIPLRIDFILPDETIEVNNFITYPVKYSDHYPIMARINF
jgi:endonuclease/exonuclease/phosphatase family metal-dependent hydrolase